MKNVLNVLKKHGFKPQREQMDGFHLWYGFLMITPQLAQYIMDHFHSDKIQRDIRPTKVDGYSADITNGLWKDNPDAIIFSITGWLINAQHRLLAIIKSGIALKMPVYVGYPEETLMVIDGQSVRTHGDRVGWMLTEQGVDLKMEKSKERKFHDLTAAIARNVFLWTNGFVPKSGGKIPAHHIQETLVKFPQIPEVARMITCLPNTTSWANPSHLGFLATIGLSVHGQKAKVVDFVKRVVQGPTFSQEDEKYSAVDVYREAKQRQMNRVNKMPDTNKFVMLVKTWNLFATDQVPASIMTIYPKGKYQPPKKVYDKALKKRVIVRGAKGENFPVLAGVAYDEEGLPVL